MKAFVVFFFLLGVTLCFATEPEYLLMRLPEGTIERHWSGADRRINTGSLLKPFLVLAYARTHPRLPVMTCRGAVDHCWLPHGHGRQNIVGALAHSCNAYFRRIADGISPAALDGISLSFGLTTLRNEPNPDELMGIGSGWPNAPVDILYAYRRLLEARSDLTAALVLKGMAESASAGTAQEAGIRCFAKTGTAPCSHTPTGAGDGFVILIYPIDQPRFILLTAVHGTTGARTARYAGEILRKELHP